MITRKTVKTGFLLAALAWPAIASPATVNEASSAAPAGASSAADHVRHKMKIDRSGKPRKGRASYYGKGFAGKKMADGTPMNPQTNNAASRTLPLGTRAKVTNLENGKSSIVEIRDRGPYVDGRIIDLSPKTARKLGVIEPGTAPVVVAPIELPPKRDE